MITIDLSTSTYARGFSSGSQIHETELKDCLKLITDQLHKETSFNPDESESVVLSHDYDTIGIFGDRGSGKTSLMVSLLQKCKNNMPDVEVLRLIDPTLVEHKKPIVLCVLAMINQLVEKKLNKSECSATTQIAEERRIWNNILKDIAIGIVAIENVGKSYSDSLWNDESYVLLTGLNKVEKSNEFELSIRKMLTYALHILGKKAFVLAFDDVDIEVNQGWEVLETIRRYFSDTRIISIVSGNQKLYGMIVRNELSKGLTIKDEASKENMANELESQYMLKLIRPEKRFNLTPLKSIIKNKTKIQFVLGTKEEEVENAYHKILKGFGIKDNSSIKLFTDFLESMSLRSQINFVKEMWDNSDKGSLKSFYVFSSRIYAAGIDWNSLVHDVRLINITILDYLLSSRNLPDYYLLLPTLTNKDLNSNLVAFSFLECENFKTNPYLMLDYLLRIGYLRNIILPINNPERIRNLISYAGWNQLMSLKNNIGLTMAFFGSKNNESHKEHISLYGLEVDGKAGEEKSVNSLDALLKKTDHNLTRLLMMFPFIKIAQSENNQSLNYYSMFALLGIICEILKCDSKEAVKETLNDLKLFRTYTVPNEGEVNGDDLENDIDIEIFSKSIDDLAKAMWDWKECYSANFIPPYALGRLATRLYTALTNVKADSVADSLNLMICDFFNACLIEEGKVKLDPFEQTLLNNDNPRSEAKVFLNNIGKKDQVEKLDFSIWIMKCPMLNSYVDKNVFEAMTPYIENFLKDKFEPGTVYGCLSSVKSKATQRSKPSFYGEQKARWKQSYQLLVDHGYSIELIRKRIINTDDASAQLFIESTGLFGTITPRSIRAFRTAFEANVPEPTKNGESGKSQETENVKTKIASSVDHVDSQDNPDHLVQNEGENDHIDEKKTTDERQLANDQRPQKGTRLQSSEYRQKKKLNE